MSKLESEISYRKWAADRLYEELHSEQERRTRLEDKAARGLSFVAVTAGIVVKLVTAPISEGTHRWWLLVIAYLTTAGAVVFAWVALYVRCYSGQNPSQISSTLNKPVAGRLGALLKHLTRTIRAVRREGNTKARAVMWSQGCALIAVLGYLYVVATGAL